MKGWRSNVYDIGDIQPPESSIILSFILLRPKLQAFEILEFIAFLARFCLEKATNIEIEQICDAVNAVSIVHKIEIIVFSKTESIK